MALTLEGGGFKALASFVGFTAGLLAARPEAALGGKEGLFSRVVNISSNSGGSWFASMLIYSSRFETLIKEIAKAPGDKDMFYDHFLLPFLKSLTGTMTVHPRFMDVPKALHKVGSGYPLGYVLEILLELIFFVGTTTNWEKFVATLLKTAGITEDQEFGSAVNAWAQGKVWRVAVSILSSGGTGPGTCQGWECLGNDTVVINATYPDVLGYRATGVESSILPNSIPAGFSIKLGAGTDSTAPQSFCTGGDGMCGALKFNYSGGEIGLSKEHALSPAMNDFHAYASSAGKLPIASIVSASSAFLGGLVSVSSPVDSNTNTGLADTMAMAKNVATLAGLVLGLSLQDMNSLKKDIFDMLATDSAVWGTSRPNGTAFAKGREWHDRAVKDKAQIKLEDLKEMAGDSMHAVVDGGMGDNTGIGGAVANGATEIVVMLDTFDSLWSMFAGWEFTESVLPPANTCPFCDVNHKAFAEDYNDVTKQFKQTAWHLAQPSGSKAGLADVYVGTIEATTVRNKYLGIRAGRRIVMHVVGAETKLGVGGYDYKDFSEMVSQVARTFQLPANRVPVDAVWGWLSKASSSTAA